MLNFKTIERLKPNSTIIDIIKCYDFKTRNGKVKILENTNVGILPLFVFSNLCILLLSPLDSHEKPLDEEDRRKYRRISYSLLIVCDAITIAAAILTVPALYYPITCGMFLEAVLLSVGKICNHSKYGSA